LTGGTGLTDGAPTLTRAFPTISPSGGAFQLLFPGVPYDAYASSPSSASTNVQQQDCDASLAPPPTQRAACTIFSLGLKVTIGAGGSTAPRSPILSPLTPPARLHFHGVLQRSARRRSLPTQLANTYSMSDNYHQAAMGAPDSITSCSALPMPSGYSDGNGNAEAPIQAQIEDRMRSRAPTTGMWRMVTAASNTPPTRLTAGGSYSACADYYAARRARGCELTSARWPSPSHPIATRRTTTCSTTTTRLQRRRNSRRQRPQRLRFLYHSAHVSPPHRRRSDGCEYFFTYFGDGWNLYLSDPNFLQSVG